MLSIYMYIEYVVYRQVPIHMYNDPRVIYYVDCLIPLFYLV